MASVTRYCPSCGLARREGDRFCRRCGSPLGTGETRRHGSPTPTAGSAPAGPTLPGPPSAPHPVAQTPVAARPAARALPFKPFAMGGGALLVVATFLPWISFGGFGQANAMDVPVEALWDLSAQDGALKVGFVTLALGLVGAGLSFVPRSAWVRRLCGSIAFAVVAAFLLQLFRGIDQAGGSLGDVFDAAGFGVYVALAGGIGLQVSR